MHRAHWIMICLACATLGSTSVAQNAPDIGTLFAQLNHSDTTDRAASRILTAASKDPEARQYVAQKLPKMIDKPETDEVWLNAVRLAGQLKVWEAILSLIHSMPRGRLGGPQVTTFGTYMRLDDDIVAKALSQIGDPAVPAVTELLNRRDREVRRRAVLILTNIGSAAAHKALQDRLPKETDPRVKDLIEGGLRS